MARTPRPALRPDDDPTLIERALERVLAVQRPVVLAHLRSVRLRHQGATPAQLAVILERRYLAAVTTGGAAVGATAVVPGIGTGITLALSGAETVGFMESTALFAQSLAELHGIRMNDPDRARALVLTLMLGSEGVALLGQFAGQARGDAPARSTYWGQVITQTLPRAAVGPAVDTLKSVFVRQFATRAGASWLGKALPFGVGAVVGGVGNNVLARRVVRTARQAFGPAPETFHPELDPPTLRLERRAGNAISALGRDAIGTVSTLGRGVSALGQSAVRGVSEPARRVLRRSDPD